MEEKQERLEEKVVKGLKRENEMKAQIRALLLQPNGTTKAEMISYTGYTDRTVRHLISEIAKKEPVILLEGRGYKLVDPDCISDKDYAALEHSYASLISRSKMLIKRAAVLHMAMNKVAVNITFKKVREKKDGLTKTN